MITDLGTLKTAIGQYTHRANSTELTAAYPLFVQATEVMINRKLRSRLNEKMATITSSTESFTLPTDFLEIRAIYREGREIISLVSPNQRNDGIGMAVIPYQREPQYSIIGDNLIYRQSGEITLPIDLEIVYYHKLLALVLDTDANTVLAAYPTLYLYGALAEYAKFAEETPDVLAKWLGLFQNELDLINSESMEAKYSGSPMSIRVF